MDKKIPLALVILVAIAVGYLIGTESGRQQREVILVKLGPRPADATADTDAPAAEDDAAS